MTPDNQLLIVVAIRRMISGSENPPVTKILNTNILDIISKIFTFNDSIELIKIMKVIEHLSLTLDSWKAFGY